MLKKYIVLGISLIALSTPAYAFSEETENQSVDTIELSTISQAEDVVTKKDKELAALIREIKDDFECIEAEYKKLIVIAGFLGTCFGALAVLATLR